MLRVITVVKSLLRVIRTQPFAGGVNAITDCTIAAANNNVTFKTNTTGTIIKNYLIQLSIFHTYHNLV